MNMNCLQKLKSNIQKVMIGNEHTLELLLTCLLARGHVLLEDVPGTGKTVMAKSLARSLSSDFGRVQFTPDLLPSDVTGLNFFDTEKNTFRFSKGPVFCNILLADEINRATPKTQSSLLECMAENQVTVDGTTRTLDSLFFVIATQNPLETLGTFPLPEAQMDRFLMQLSMEALNPQQELSMIERFLTKEPLQSLEAVCTREEILALQEECRRIFIHKDLMDYMVQIIHATRTHSQVEIGVSPRGTLAFVRAVQGYAMLKGRDYATPEDIKAVAVPVLAHRLSVNVSLDAGRIKRQIIEQLLNSVPLPTENFEKPRSI